MDIKDKVLNKYDSLKGKDYLKDKIIDGTVIAEEIKSHIRENKKGQPGLLLIQAGEDYASEQYLKSIEKNCKEFGINFYQSKFNEELTHEQLEETIMDSNNSNKITSVMIHTPLPKSINKTELYDYILPSNDVDCVTDHNLIKIFDTNRQAGILPCTVSAVMKIFSHYKINLERTKIVVLGRSMTVGKPLAAILEKHNATVTICHSKTRYGVLIQELKSADIIISAIGKPKYITADMIGKGQILIDVAINYHEGKMCGDFDFESVIHDCHLITPVPFGVGTVTSMCLIENILINYNTKKGDMF